jgi:hypothetical protein
MDCGAECDDRAGIGQGWVSRCGHAAKKGKRFFFEKKKQKTFVMLSRALPTAHLKTQKFFWFFFSKKNILACL